MSETRQTEWKIPEETVEKLAYVSQEFGKLNTGATGDEFWLIVQDDSEGDYEGDGLAVGVNKAGELIQATDSHCSCNGNFDDGFKAFGNQKLSGNLTVEFDDLYHDHEDWLPELIETTDTLYAALTGETVNPEAIIGLPNAEIRRAVVELVGYDKIIDAAEELDRSEVDGTLLRIKLPEDEDLVLVHVKDPSTDREYFLRVPPQMKTARQARAWTFGFEAEEFALEKES